MKERLIKLWDEISSQSFSNEEQKSDSDFWDFLNEMNTTTPSSMQHLDPRKLKWIGTFHSIFLKILKEDIERLEMKYNKINYSPILLIAITKLLQSYYTSLVNEIQYKAY